MGRTFIRSLRIVSSIAIAAGLASALPPALMAQEAAPQSAAAPSAEVGGVPAWDIIGTDFPANPDVTFGRLPNGMRYALMRNANPKGEAAIRFTVEVGSREETQEENGAAHFVEHMAFNGSKGIPEGQLLPMLERLGLSFGADTNAETGLDYTTYKLQLPRTDEETVGTALKVIREMAGELTLEPAAVDRERGIMLNEAQVRNDPGRRRIADYLQAALPGSRVGERVRADEERIRNITAVQLRAFYEAYYRPERATLAIVGDFDVAAMEARIKSTFSDWSGDGAARDTYQSPLPSETDAPAMASFVDPAIPEIIELQRISAWKPSANTVAASREELLRAVAAVALSNRMNALARTADSPTLGAQAADQPLFRSARSFGLLAVAKDGQWAETLALAERELRRANTFGFTSAEIAEAKANIQTALANAVAQASGRNSAALAEGLISSSLQNAVPTSPAFNLAFYQAIEASLTPEAVSEAFKQAWQGSPTLVHISTKQPIAGQGEAIAAVLAQSAAVAVTPPAEEADVQWAYGAWGEPGKVIADEAIADLGIRTVRFANGLQLNLKVTDFEPGKVGFRLRIGSGLAAFPAHRQGLREMLPIIASIDGFEAHSIDELRRVLAGKSVSLGFDGEEDALIAYGVTTPADLKLQLDLLGARLTASGWRPETAAQWEGIAPIVVQNVRANSAQLLSVALGAVLADNDARFGLADPGQLAQLSLEDLRAVVAPQLANGPLALALVGDFDADAAIAAVAATLGALPERVQRREEISTSTPARFVTDRSVKVLTHTGTADQGAITVSWPGTDGRDLKDDITRDLLADVLTLRLTEKLREELGATYSPSAFSYAPLAFEGFGHITAFATVPPEAMDETAAAIRAIAGELAAQPPAADLLERARAPMRANYERAETQNAVWLGLVAEAQSNPSLLDRRRQRLTVLDAITPADLQAAAKRYLVSETPVEIRVVPEAADQE
jgi:zinc protease